MDKIKIIRLICVAVIVVGFFLPWLDLGEMGEMMSGLAAMTGEEFSSTFSGYQLAIGGKENPGGEGYPLLWGVPVFGLLVFLVNKKRILMIFSVLAIFTILIYGPMLKEGAQMMSSGMTSWAIGKILSISGFVVFLITAYTGGRKTEATSP